jgi:glutaredoxin-related protein
VVDHPDGTLWLIPQPNEDVFRKKMIMMLVTMKIQTKDKKKKKKIKGAIHTQSNWHSSNNVYVKGNLGWCCPRRWRKMDTEMMRETEEDPIR